MGGLLKRLTAMGVAGLLLGLAASAFAQVADSPAVARAREDVAKVRQSPQAAFIDPFIRLGQALMADQRFGDAEAVFRELLSLASARFAGDTPQRAAALYNLGDAVRQAGRPAEAEPIL